MALFSFLQGVPKQSGYNMNIDLSRKPSNFRDGYNMDIDLNRQPVNFQDGYNMTLLTAPPSLLATPEQSQQAAPPMKTKIGSDESQAAMNEAKAMAAQGSPMLSQVQQMGGRYRRQMKGLLG